MQGREDISKSNVFISWTGADEKIKSEIVRYLKDRNLTVCESSEECAGNFMQWSVGAAVKSSVFLLVLTENLVANEKSVARQEIKAWKEYLKESGEFSNRTVVVCKNLALLSQFKDEFGKPYIAADDCLSCEIFGSENTLTDANLQNIYNKATKLIVNRMSLIYAENSASGRGIDITRLLGVDLLDTEKTEVDFDKIYIPRSLAFNNETYDSAKTLADNTKNDVLFITAKAGSGKSCFIGQIINEYKNIDGALVLTAACTDAARYCAGNRSSDGKYPVLLGYLFKKFIENCGIGESFYTIDNFASLISDKIDGGKDVVIALDAIDEIAVQDNTRAFVGYVEELQKFCKNKVKVIVTDRGDTSAKMFSGACVCKLNEFNDGDINDYCNKLFGLLDKKCLTNKELNIGISDLKDKVKHLKNDIKRNPFMLTQIISLYATTGKINDSEIGMFDDITDVMFKSERLKSASAGGKATPSNIVEMLEEFAYVRQVTLSKGGYMTRSKAVRLFDRLLRESGETARSGLNGEDLTEYIEFRAIYSFKENKFFHESYGEYLVARYFFNLVIGEDGEISNEEKMNELLLLCSEPTWDLIIRMFILKSKIKSIKIPKGVTRISSLLFLGCDSLHTVYLPDSVTDIDLHAFMFHETLIVYYEGKELFPMNSMEFAFAFGACPVVWDCNNNDVATDGCVYLEKDDLRYAIKDGKVRFAVQPTNSDEEIRVSDFIVYKGEKYAVEKIPDCAFAYCENLKEIFIPDTIESIDDFAFGHCMSLEKIIVDEKNGFFCAIEGNLYSKDKTTLIKYAQAKKDKSFIVPESVVNINMYAFNGCVNLEVINLPDSINNENMQWMGFLSDSVVEFKIAVSNNGYVIVDGSVYSKDKKVLIRFVDRQKTKRVVIPHGTEVIGERAFADCNFIEEIVVSDTVTTISDGAFFNCKSLKSVRIAGNVVTVGNNAFSYCKALEKVEFSENLNEIGKDAFSYCHSIKSIRLPEGITVLKENLFKNCTSLEEVVLPEGLIEIEANVFDFCTSLKSIVLPKSLRVIDSFWGSFVSMVYFGETKGWKAGDIKVNPSDLENPDSAADLLAHHYSLFKWQRN